MFSRALYFSKSLQMPRQPSGVMIALALMLVLAACGLSSEPKVVSILPTPTAAPISSTPDVTGTTMTTTVAPGNATPAPASTAQGTLAAPQDATKLPATADVQVAGVINGQISNGTAGGKVPPNLNLVLHLLDQNSNETTQNTTADANGSFSFKNVPIQADRVYVVTTSYLDRTFGSEFVNGDPTKTTMDMPVKIYELTSAPDVIKITSLTTQVNASTDGLQVAQVIHVQNTSDKMFTSDKKIDQNRYASVTFSLPKGASVMGFANDEQRYSIAPDGTTITDTAPVVPGEDHVMHVIYTMPYKDGTVVEQPINYALDGMVQLLLQPETLTAKTDQLASLGVQTQRGASYQSYANGVKLTPGSVLKYELHGSAAATTNASASGSVISRELIVGILVGLGIGIVLVGIVFMVRDRMVGRKPAANEYDSETQQRIDTLVDQMAQLDDAFSSGQVDKKSYEKRRQRLKIRLSRLMAGGTEG